MMIWSKLRTLIITVHETLAGTIENKLALRGNRVLLIPQSGIGDQLLCISAYVEFSKSHELHLLVRKQHEELMTCLLQDSPVYLHSFEYNSKLTSNNFSSRNSFRKFAKSLDARILSLSDLHLRISRYGRPDTNPVAHMYRLMGLDSSSYRFSPELDDYFTRGEQLPFPKEKYALIDHYPQTNREIPLSILRGIEARGLTIIYARKDVPFNSMKELIINADELHLVNSSLLCAALIINPDGPKKFIYIANKIFLLGHLLYDSSWIEIDISGRNSFGERIAILIDRGIELELARRKSRVLRRRFVESTLFRGNHIQGHSPNEFIQETESSHYEEL